jgi:diaminopropionate ammonia-lyase
MKLVRNPAFDRAARYGDIQRHAFDPDEASRVRDELSRWPVYAETPLLQLPGLAAEAGIESLYVKDEGCRYPLKSFKALGGAYALGEALRDRIEGKIGVRPDYPELFAGAFKEENAGFRAVAVTDGNHGRSLAWGAQLFGVECGIYLPVHVSPEREEAIARYGAKITRIDDTYDAAVERLRKDAAKSGWTMIQDVSTEDDWLAHRRIMHGYSLMAEEIERGLAGTRPTHMLLQVGCGGLAGMLLAYFWTRFGQDRPITILIEPSNTASTLASFEAGYRTSVGGDLETLMVGMAVGETSLLPWYLFEKGAEFALALGDECVPEVMRRTARGVAGDPPMVVGETGAAGLAALLELARSPALAAEVGLGSRSRVLVINTEGDTDPTLYAAIVGRSPESGK